MGFWDDFKKEMDIANQKQVVEQDLIKTGKLIVLVYLGGHPKIKEGKVKVVQGTEKNQLIINDHEIVVTRIEWDEKGKRSAGKAAAGAIIGGLLTGGIGTIAGVAIGGRKKDNSITLVTFMDGIIEHTIYFRCNNKEYNKLISLL